MEVQLVFRFNNLWETNLMISMHSKVLQQFISFLNNPYCHLSPNFPIKNSVKLNTFLCPSLKALFTFECKINENLKHKNRFFDKEFEATWKFSFLHYYKLDLPQPDPIYLECFRCEKKGLIPPNKTSEKAINARMFQIKH